MTTLANDLLWVAGAVLLLALVWYLTRRHQHQQAARHDADPRKEIVNTTNYNIAKSGPELDDPDELAADEARQILATWKKEDYIPTDEEFHRVQRALNSQ
jgi:hypothetical protein